MTVKEFERGWLHFCDCMDFNHSALDFEAITWMNEMLPAVTKGLTSDEKVPPSESSKKSKMHTIEQMLCEIDASIHKLKVLNDEKRFTDMDFELCIISTFIMLIGDMVGERICESFDSPSEEFPDQQNSESKL